MTIHAYRDETDTWYSLCGNDAADLTHEDTEVECWECRSIIGISDETDIANNDVLRVLVDHTCPDCRREIVDGKGHLRACLYHEDPQSRHPFGNTIAAPGPTVPESRD